MLVLLKAQATSQALQVRAFPWAVLSWSCSHQDDTRGVISVAARHIVQVKSSYCLEAVTGGAGGGGRSVYTHAQAAVVFLQRKLPVHRHFELSCMLRGSVGASSKQPAAILDLLAHMPILLW